MNKYTTYVGMDVHARSVSVSAIVPETGEVAEKKFSGCPTAAVIAEWLGKLPKPVYCAYESGCTGYGLARDLREIGYDCDVIAVSTLPKSTKDKKQKCDKLDARAIRREICNPDRRYSVVWIPSRQIEADRNLARAHRVAVDALKQAKQRLEMFLLRNGYVWNERTKAGNLRKTWTRAYERWLDGISFEEPSNEIVFAAMRREVQLACQEARLLREEVRKLAATPRYRPFVLAIVCLKGLTVETAVLACVEIGDFGRFTSGRKLSCWLGTVPSDDSSGDDEKHGRITKAGNKYLRRALIEGFSAICNWSPRPKEMPEGYSASAATLAIATKANARLFERYDYLAREKHLNHNKAKVAVVSELIRWIWVIGLQVQRELEAKAA